MVLIDHGVRKGTKETAVNIKYLGTAEAVSRGKRK